MNFFKRVFSLFLLLFFSSSLYATPQFAKENKLSCSTCHSSVPMLNDMGRMFLRNGFRFSKEDKTTLKKFIDQKDSNKTYIPLAVMLSTKYNSITDDSKFSMGYKLFSAGTLTSKLSYFISVSDENNREYLQYNIDESKHVIRVGKLSPFTQLTNIKRLSAGSALKGNNGNDGKGNGNEGGNNADKGGKKTSSKVLAKYGGQSSPPKNNTTTSSTNTNANNSSNNSASAQGGGENGNRPYKTPIQNSYFRNYWGVEYSYQYNYNTIFMIGFGKTTNNSTDKKGGSSSSNNAQNDLDPDSADKNQIVTGVRHVTDKGYAIGVMLDKIPDSDKTNFSTVTFMEKEVGKLYIYLSLVYKNNKNGYSDYYGTENGLVYQLNNTSNLKTVVNIDNDEYDFHNTGYLVSYSTMYKRVSLNISVAQRETATKRQNILQTSVKLFF